MNRVHFVFAACIFFLFFSCSSNEGSNTDTANDTVNSSRPVPETVSPIAGCYTMIQQRDTAILTLNVLDSRVSGKLQYRRFQKDRNDGVIAGIIRDSLIVAKYAFQSEGMSSVREVVFSIKGDSLFEGYGEIVVRGDTTKFVNTNQLKFMTVPFVKTPCTDQ